MPGRSHFLLIFSLLCTWSAACGSSSPGVDEPSYPTLAPQVTAVPSPTTGPPTQTATAEIESPQAGAVCQAALAKLPDLGNLECMATTGFDQQTCSEMNLATKSSPVMILIHRQLDDTDQGWYIHLHERFPAETSTDLDEIRSVFCIEPSLKNVGCYVQGGRASLCGPLDPAAYEQVWNVRLVQWPHGWVINATEMTGGLPPEQIDSSDQGYLLTGPGIGDEPVSAFQEWMDWLRTIY